MFFSCVFFFFFNILCYHMRWGKCDKQWRTGREPAMMPANRHPWDASVGLDYFTPIGEPLRPYL